MKILAIIPAFNEQDNIKDLLHRFSTLDVDVLIVNDCSTDNTGYICSDLAKVNDRINLINLPCNLGIGGAVQTGYKYALLHDYDIAIQVDGDGQHNPEYIQELIAPIISTNADFVIGSRYLEKKGFQSTYLRRFGINYFTKLIKILYGYTVTDPTSGFRACNKKIIQVFGNNYPVDYPEPESIVLLLRERYKIKEVAVIMNERSGGKSSINTYKAVYYMIKVSLAVLIDTLRKKPLYEAK